MTVLKGASGNIARGQRVSVATAVIIIIIYLENHYREVYPLASHAGCLSSRVDFDFHRCQSIGRSLGPGLIHQQCRSMINPNPAAVLQFCSSVPSSPAFKLTSGASATRGPGFTRQYRKSPLHEN